MALGFGQPYVRTAGPKFGSSIVRPIGEAADGGSFENPYPDPVTFEAVIDFEDDIEMRDDKTLWLDTTKTRGIRYDAASGIITIVGGSIRPDTGESLILQSDVGDNTLDLDDAIGLTANTKVVFSGKTGVDEAPINIPIGTPSAPITNDVWMNNSSQLMIEGSGGSRTVAFLEGADFTGTVSFSALTDFAQSATGFASYNIPAGDVPSAPANGDVWNTGAAHFHRLAGVSEEVLYV